MGQAHWHPGAVADLERKRAEGKRPAEARRCLMRHLASVVHRAMLLDAAAAKRVRRCLLLDIAAPQHNLLLRLFTAVLRDKHDEWQGGRRLISQQSMARVLHPDGPALLTNTLTTALVA